MRPPIMTSEILLLRMSRMSPSLMTMLASLPVSIDPVRSAMPRIFAAFNVIEDSASSFVNP